MDKGLMVIMPHSPAVVRLFREEAGRLVEVESEPIDDKVEKEVERLILSQPEVLGEDLLFIGEQSNFPEIAGDAIDILALDREGNTVIIELKRGQAPSDTDFQLLKYAGYVHTLGPEDLAKKAKEFFGQERNAWYRESLEKKLGLGRSLADEIDLVDLVYRKFRGYNYEVYDARFNKKQRIVLVAEAFDKRIGSVLIWLHRQGVDVAGYTYARFKAGDNAFFAFDRVIPPPDIESELAESARKHIDRAWLRDGRAWHHNPDETWSENVALVDSLESKLARYPSIEIRWNQRMYIKVYGPSRRELRVYTQVKKKRIDLVFMHASKAEVEEVLTRHGAKNEVVIPYVYEDSPYVGVSSEEELEGPLTSSIGVWLSEAAK
jgi:hypothetical protein